ncbi:MAG: hypothetical protein IJF87_05960 [Erysipelotrichaceae bacterium]|nr:hypothetical protein [Erysipelotrichaceae bacterium]
MEKEYIWKVNKNGDFNEAYFVRAKSYDEALAKGRTINPKYNCALIMEEVNEEEKLCKI